MTLDDKDYFFIRNLADAKNIIQCEDGFTNPKTISEKEYRKFIEELYCLDKKSLSLEILNEIVSRIYGNVYFNEHYPYHHCVNETDTKTIDWLLAIAGKNSLEVELNDLRKELNLKKNELNYQDEKLFDDSILIEVENDLGELYRQRDGYTDLEEENHFKALGFDCEEQAKLSKLKESVRQLTRKRNDIQAHIDSIEFMDPLQNTRVVDDFEELAGFFPSVKIKKLEDIEEFHKTVRKMLNDYATKEIGKLEQEKNNIDAQIDAYKETIKESGVVRQITRDTISKCVEISSQIEELEKKKNIYEKTKENIEISNQFIDAFNLKLQERKSSIFQISAAIGEQLDELGAYSNSSRINNPHFAIIEQEDGKYRIDYSIPGNSSERSAFKGVLLYDLALVHLFKLPYLFHDSHILSTVEESILDIAIGLYGNLKGTQVFVALDRNYSSNESTVAAVEQAKVIDIDRSVGLFGNIWSRNLISE